MSEDELRTMLVALDGKVDRVADQVRSVNESLAGKIDASHSTMGERLLHTHELIGQKIEGVFREASQLVQFVDARVADHAKKLEEHDKRITNVAETAQRRLEAYADETERKVQTLDAFRVQAKTVIALVAVLMPILTGLAIKWIG